MEIHTLMGLCPDCGNLRDALEACCPFCECAQSPLPNPDLADKIYVINLEAGMPSVEDALERLGKLLCKAHTAGVRIIKVIHGYGSSGKGGLIRAAFREALLHHRWGDQVREYLPGESLKAGNDALHALSRHHRHLIKHLSGHGHQGNPGITMLMMG